MRKATRSALLVSACTAVGVISMMAGGVEWGTGWCGILIFFTLAVSAFVGTVPYLT